MTISMFESGFRIQLGELRQDDYQMLKRTLRNQSLAKSPQIVKSRVLETDNQRLVIKHQPFQFELQRNENGSSVHP